MSADFCDTATLRLPVISRHGGVDFRCPLTLSESGHPHQKRPSSGTKSGALVHQDDHDACVSIAADRGELSGADTIGAIFIFLKLLKRYPQSISELLLA